jgi:hypothetical protein
MFMRHLVAPCAPVLPCCAPFASIDHLRFVGRREERIVGNVLDLIGEGVGLSHARTHVVAKEIFVLSQPVLNRPSIRHIVPSADHGQAKPFSDTLANLVRCLFVIE